MSIQKLNYSHDAVIDQIIAQPGISNNELAAMFGYSPGWMSIVKNSDAFKERLEVRKAQIIDPELTCTVKDRFAGLVARSLDLLQEKLSAPASQVPDQLVLKALELGAKANSIGGFGVVAPPVSAPAPNHLEQLAERLLALQSKVREAPREVVVIENEAA